MELVIVAIVSVVFGVVMGILATQSRKKLLQQEVMTLQAQVENVKEESQEKLKFITQEKDKVYQALMDAQQKRFDETMEKVSAQVTTATEDMLKKRQKEFADSSNENLGQIVNPLKDTIEQMKKAMNDSTMKQTELGGEMKSHIETMIRQSEAAKDAYDEGEKKLQPSGQSILQTCNKLTKLGAKQSAKNPLPQLADAESELICA